MGANEKLKNINFKSWKLWSVVAGVIIVLIISYSIGSSSANAELNGEKVNYDKLVSQINNQEEILKNTEELIQTRKEELDAVQKELDDLEAKFDSREEEFNDALAAVENKAEIEKEIDNLTAQVDSKKSEVEGLNTQIEEKNNELAAVSGKIVAAEGEPKTLSAGQYIVGTDIPVSRYKAEPVGGGSNFVVYSSSGELLVNTILGSGTYDESEYVFFTDEGSVIDTASSVKLTPVE